ncbi:MAG: iron-sulfur cluster assembly scaffold protein [Verrucomicrobiia bacterium]
MESHDLQKAIEKAASDPTNLGEMADADAVGTVGNSDCGDLLRMWVKFKDEGGRRVIDRASFQSFGCQTAIAVASVATELIRGRTANEALAMSGQDLAAPLGALPPMKIHCAKLVEDAIRSALTGAGRTQECATQAKCAAEPGDQTLLGSLTEGTHPTSPVTIRFLS